MKEIAGILRFLNAGRPYWRRQKLIARREDLVELARIAGDFAEELEPEPPLHERCLFSYAGCSCGVPWG